MVILEKIFLALSKTTNLYILCTREESNNLITLQVRNIKQVRTYSDNIVKYSL